LAANSVGNFNLAEIKDLLAVTDLSFSPKISAAAASARNAAIAAADAAGAAPEFWRTIRQNWPNRGSGWRFWINWCDDAPAGRMPSEKTAEGNRAD